MFVVKLVNLDDTVGVSGDDTHRILCFSLTEAGRNNLELLLVETFQPFEKLLRIVHDVFVVDRPRLLASRVREG